MQRRPVRGRGFARARASLAKALLRNLVLAAAGYWKRAPPSGFVHRVWLWARALARAYAGPAGAFRLLRRHPWLRPHITIFVARDVETFLASARWSQVEAWWGQCPSEDRLRSTQEEALRRWSAKIAGAPTSTNLHRIGVPPCDLVWAMAVLGIL